MSEPPSGEAVQPPAAQTTEAPPPAGAKAADNATAAADSGPKKLSPAELKKQKQAEKQAKRAQAKATGAPQAGPKEAQKAQKDAKQAPKNDKSKPIPLRTRESATTVPTTPKESKGESKVSKTQAKRQPGLFFGHLYTQPRQHSMVGARKEVHPAVLALGLQYSSYTICGSTARMVSMLLAFKAVIESYTTPVGTSLARHLISHHLSPQIDYLRSCRPLSIGMGNANRCT